MLHLSKHDKIKDLFPDWDKLSEETRIRIRELLNSNKTWAHKELVQIYGLPCDSDSDGCNGGANAGGEPPLEIN